MARVVTYRYTDPLTQVWVETARRIGLRVVRTPDAYAATDGHGTLSIGDATTLDTDDSLAQMIFHELCHSLVEGEDSFRTADWGMDNTSPADDWREHACLRVQWVLTGRHGLRTVFAPTTDYRSSFWDQLSGDVLADRTDRSVQAAIAALRRVDHPPWGPHLGEALAATARIAHEAARFAAPVGSASPSSSASGSSAAPSSSASPSASLWTGVAETRPAHPTGLPSGDATGNCGTCAWRYDQRGVSRCRQADAAKVDASWPACERYEAATSLDCQTCGACCRAAYHSVEVSRRDPAVKAQPSFIVDRGSYLEIRRNGDRCSALEGGHFEDTGSGSGGGGTATRFRCVIYDDRPRTCREFTLGSAHCLTARRRVGLSL